MFRLCFLADAPGIHVRRWLAHFVERGHEVNLLTFRPGEVEGARVHALGARRAWPSGARFAGKLLEARGLLRELKPDLVHAHYLIGYGWMGAAAALRPRVLSLWGSDLLVEGRRRWFGRLNAWALERMDLVTADSADLLERARRVAGPEPRLERIIWGVDFSALPAPTPERTRAALGVGDDQRLIYSPRAFRPIYNLEAIVRGFARLHRRRPDSVLVLKSTPGDDPAYRARIEAAIADENVGEAVRIAPVMAHAEVLRLTAAADAVVTAAASDGTPVSLLEAMAFGRVIVALRLPSIAAWLEDSANGSEPAGFLIDRLDPETLADALAAALDLDDERRRRWAERNERRVREDADWRGQMARMEGLYGELISRGH